MEHKKGPWCWNKNGTITDESGKKIAYTHLEENNANNNTRLIAAAPDLYETLNDVADFWAGGDCPAELWLKIKSALAKAEKP